MKLYHRDFGGEGLPPLLILHGLLGSSRNWTAAARDLIDTFQVIGLDARNHGNSPHSSEHSYERMAEDVVAWMDDAGLDRAFLLGHSMGGKTAMRIACKHPDRIRALVVVDIAPREKEPKHAKAVRALRELPLEAIASRTEADQVLAQRVPSRELRQFLLTNLVRREEGGWKWQANVPVLDEQIAETGRAGIDADDSYDGPALWIAGGKSDFVQPEDHDLIRRHFPRARIEVFPESGHNPHADARERFTATVRDFLKQAEASAAPSGPGRPW